MKVAIINYGMGNLASVRRSFEDIGVEACIANHPATIYDADKVVLPGVGSFAEGMACLRSAGWVDALHEVVMQHKKPLLGICLGMQMLASAGVEGGHSLGLNFVPGQVHKLDILGCKLRIPHVGWNEVTYKTDDTLFKKIPNASDFYFVHSYAFVAENNEHLIAVAPYGGEVAAAVRNHNVFGCQFHPEKSSKVGLQLLRNFMEYTPC